MGKNDTMRVERLDAESGTLTREVTRKITRTGLEAERDRLKADGKALQARISEIDAQLSVLADVSVQAGQAVVIDTIKTSD